MTKRLVEVSEPLGGHETGSFVDPNCYRFSVLDGSLDGLSVNMDLPLSTISYLNRIASHFTSVMAFHGHRFDSLDKLRQIMQFYSRFGEVIGLSEDQTRKVIGVRDASFRLYSFSEHPENLLTAFGCPECDLLMVGPPDLLVGRLTGTVNYSCPDCNTNLGRRGILDTHEWP